MKKNYWSQRLSEYYKFTTYLPNDNIVNFIWTSNVTKDCETRRRHGNEEEAIMIMRCSPAIIHTLVDPQMYRNKYFNYISLKFEYFNYISLKCEYDQNDPDNMHQHIANNRFRDNIHAVWAVLYYFIFSDSLFIYL